MTTGLLVAVLVAVSLAGCSQSEDTVVIVASKAVCWKGSIGSSDGNGRFVSRSIQGCGSKTYERPKLLRTVSVEKKSGALPVCIELQHQALVQRSWCTTSASDDRVGLRP